MVTKMMIVVCRDNEYNYKDDDNDCKDNECNCNVMNVIIAKLKKKKKGVVRWDLEGPISSGYLAHCSHLLFHEHSHRVFGILLYGISEFCDTDFAGQVVYKP